MMTSYWRVFLQPLHMEQGIEAKLTDQEKEKFLLKHLSYSPNFKSPLIY